MTRVGIGQSVRRVEDRKFLTGHGRYIDDISRPRQAHATFLRSPYAHARIRAIDVTAAEAAPGVLAVLTGADLAGDGLGTLPCVSDVAGSILPPRPAMVADRVRYVGDTVAMVVAESIAAARDATGLILVDYEDLPAVVETAVASDPGQPQVWDEAKNNHCFDWEIGNMAAVAKCATSARHAVTLTLINNRVVVNSMEPRGAIGEYDPGEDAYILWSSTQGSHFVRNLLAEHVLRIPENRNRFCRG
jgi:carbon-monoxide dehydrogenase large subunit